MVGREGGELYLTHGGTGGRGTIPDTRGDGREGNYTRHTGGREGGELYLIHGGTGGRETTPDTRGDLREGNYT